MYKIVMTGGNKGFGVKLFEQLKQAGHEVERYSRSNGYDISKPEDRLFITDATNSCDVFINLAYNHSSLDNSQELMIKEVYERHYPTHNLSNAVPQRDNVKPLLITIGSHVVWWEEYGEEAKMYRPPDADFYSEILNFDVMAEYIKSKKSHYEYVKDKRISNVRLGAIHSGVSATNPVTKDIAMPYDSMYNVINFIMEMYFDKTIFVYDIEVN